MKVALRANFATLLKEILEKHDTVRLCCANQTFHVRHHAVVTSDCVRFQDEDDRVWIVPFSAIQRVSTTT
ncbi:hypothetical protein ACFQU1_04740 [Chelatococcus sp. GCM10030263]|uniref:hypothetical protein n=1 Tax=Chelatococcus sp. GCM10030263 TaxID=3273387 RepID=UPI00361AA6D6